MTSPLTLASVRARWDDRAVAPPKTVPPHVLLLGPIEVDVDGRVAPVTSASQRILLAHLALGPGRVVSSDRLVEALWGDAPPPSAVNSLQSHLARLRRVLGDPDLVVARAPGYLLALDPEHVDVVRFERLVEEARLAAGPAEVAAGLEQALALWRGPALAGADDGVLRDAATRLDRLRHRAVIDRADALLQLRRPDATLAALEEAGPTSHDEPATELAIRALALSGRTAEADEVFRAHRAALDELGLEPSPAIQRLHVALLRGELGGDPQVTRSAVGTPRSPAAPPGGDRPVRCGVPPMLSTFIGRQAELDRLAGLLPGARLVTVVGPGGVGKTRLVAERVREEPDVVWVDLTPATDAAGVHSAVSLALGGATSEGSPTVAALLDAFGRTPPSILVLDNVEQVAEPVAGLVAGLLQALPDATLIATSRERLGLDGERVLDVRPLSVRGAADGELAPAVALLVDRAAPAIDPADPDQRQLAREIVTALDGLPLAIELAASQVRNLGLAALRDRLDQRLDLVATSRRTGRPAHRGLRALIRWSTDLLDVEESRLFHRLGVFAGGFGLELAEAVVTDESLPRARVAPLLSALVDRSLVVAERPGRFRLLGILRSAALEGLTDTDEFSMLRHRHAAAVVTEAERLDRLLWTASEPEAVAAMHALGPDLDLAHRLARRDGDAVLLVRLAAAVHRYAYHGLREDLLAWGEHAVDAIDRDAAVDGLPSNALAMAAVAAAAHAMSRGDLALAAVRAEQARSHAVGTAAAGAAEEAMGDLCLTRGEAERALEAYGRMLRAGQETGEPYLEAFARFGMGLVHAYTGDLTSGVAALDEADRIAAELGNPSLSAWVAYSRGEVEADRDPDAAMRYLGEACTIARTVDNHLLTGVATAAASSVLARHGEPREALERFREALEHWRERSNRMLQATTLRNVAVLLARIGADEAAAILIGVADVGPLYEAERRRLAHARAAVSERLGEERAGQLHARGAAASPDALLQTALEAIEEALATADADRLRIGAGDPG